ncbi:MAG: hypothetical protein Q7K43_03195 [Candidatus Woesearchaeota archaeon]|nr:hypothetical protein [Candidatus Woesearchaeota archaeon]
MPLRSFMAVRNDLLACLASGPKTLNLVSRLTGVVWPAVKRHGTWLCEQGLARRILNTKYVVILELTTKGKEEATVLQKQASERKP